MKIILNATDGSAVSVDVRPDETYQMLKERVQVESGLELEISQIFYDGKQVAADQNVYDSFLGGNLFLYFVHFLLYPQNEDFHLTIFM